MLFVFFLISYVLGRNHHHLFWSWLWCLFHRSPQQSLFVGQQGSSLTQRRNGNGSRWIFSHCLCCLERIAQTAQNARYFRSKLLLLGCVGWNSVYPSSTLYGRSQPRSLSNWHCFCRYVYHHSCISTGFEFFFLFVRCSHSLQIFAMLADKVGKVPMIAVGSLLLSGSMLILPRATSFEELMLAIIPMALGSTVLSQVPQAYLGDIARPHERSQSVSFFRTIGDLGFLAGATFSGVASQLSSIPLTMEMNTTFVCAGLFWFLLRRKLGKGLPK